MSKRWCQPHCHQRHHILTRDAHDPMHSNNSYTQFNQSINKILKMKLVIKFSMVFLLLLSCFCIFSFANANMNEFEVVKKQGSLRGLTSSMTSAKTCTYTGNYCNSCNDCGSAYHFLTCYCLKSTTATRNGIKTVYNLSRIDTSTCTDGKINNVGGTLTCVTN